jgi:CBS domain-containing protein
MTQLKTQYTGVAIQAVVSFLEKVWPFAPCERLSLEDLARGSLLGFYPKQTVIVAQGALHPDHLFLIEKGAVRIYKKEPDGNVTLLDYRGEGCMFGVSSIVNRENSPFTVEATEDTFCYLLDKGRFLEFVQNNPIFLDNYFHGFSQEKVCTAYTELHSHNIRERGSEGVRLANVRAGDAITGDPVVVDTGESIHKVAELMNARDASVVMVRSLDGSVVGMVTDRDLRSKVVAQRLDYDQPVATIMTAELSDVPAESSCLDALVQMMTTGVFHLMVRQGGQWKGVLSINDIMKHEFISPLYLVKEIDAQNNIEGLYAISSQVPRLVQDLVDVGARATNITRIITVMNDRIVGRVLAFMEGTMGPPPVPFCWMVMGSEGRMEQTLRTDQDNAILYEDLAEDWEQIKAAKLYFRELGNEMAEHLVKCGFPLCKGGFMSSRTTWRKPFSIWTSYFQEWLSSAEQESMLVAKIFLDFRCSYGSNNLAERLRDYVTDQTRKRSFFINHLAKDSLVIKPPLSFFRNFIVEGDGEHKNRLDLKLRGMVPIIDFARAMALKNGISETNTMSRLSRLQEQELVPKDLCSEIIEAYEFLMHLRLLHQLRTVHQGVEPHNFVDPADLSDLEKQTLRGAFGVINRMQSFMARDRVEI